jgi:hypothetical protein
MRGGSPRRREELAQARWEEFDSREEPHHSRFTVATVRVKMNASAKLEKQPTYKVPLLWLRSKVAQLLQLAPDVILANGTPAAKTMQQASRSLACR